MEATSMTVATVLETLTSVVTSVVGVFTSVLEFVVGNPLMLAAILIPVAVAFIPKGLTLIKRALGKKKI